MKDERISEIVAQMTAFRKETYYNGELLEEMLKLQKEMVFITFGEEVSDTASLRIVDVERYLEELNEQQGHIADNEIEQFKSRSKMFCDQLRGEISGQRGEERVYEVLVSRLPKGQILRNVELRLGSRKTEIDFVVITTRGLTIIETKNTWNNVEIDADGNYAINGKYMRRDGNIKEKLEYRKAILEELLRDNGLRNVPVNTLLVFTNDRAQVHNLGSIPACYANQVIYNLYRQRDPIVLNDNNMARIAEAIGDAVYRQAYPFKFGVVQYKQDFATVLALLTDCSDAEKTMDLANTDGPTRDGEDFWYQRLAERAISCLKYAVPVAGGLIALVAAADTINKGGA